MVKGAVYVLLHPCKGSCGVRMQLCGRICLDKCDQYLCVRHEGHCRKMKPRHKES